MNKKIKKPSIDVELNGVKFDNNGTLDVFVNSSNATPIRVIYDPETYVNKKGTWDCKETLIKKIYESGVLCTFIAIDAGTSTITFIPDDDPSLSASCTVTATYNSVQSLKLNPYEETVGMDEEFKIQLEYTPSTADFEPVWTYDESLVKLLPDSTKDVGYFKAISSRPAAGKITCTVDELSASNNFYIGDNPPNSLSVNPTSVTSMVGEKFNLKVDFDPSNSDTSGIWDYDKNYFDAYASSIFPGLLSVTPLKVTPDNSPLNITFKAANNKSISVPCTIQSAPIQSITLRPSQTNIRAGEGFYIDLEFDPDNAPQTGNWSYDKEFFEMIILDDEPTRAYFMALKTTLGKTSPIYLVQGSVQSNIVDMIVDYSKLERIELDPPHIGFDEVMKAGTPFTVKIKYVPDTAEHVGLWDLEQFEDFIVKGSESPDEISFLAIKDTLDQTDGSISIPFTSGYVTTNLKCKFDYSDLKSVTFDKDKETIAYKDENLTINLTYDPPTALKGGTWNIDPPYLTLASDPKDTTAIFVQNENAIPNNTVKLTFTPDAHYSGTKPENKCLIAHSVLKGVSISPTSGTFNVGEDVKIDITYEPETAEHNGSFNWSYNTQYLKLDYSKTTDDYAVFTALKPTPADGSGTKLVNYPINGDTSIHSEEYTCYINFEPIKDVKLDPESSTVKQGEVTSIGVNYNPNEVLKNGHWEYDMDKLSLSALSDVSDLTQGATFYAIKGAPAGETEIKFVYDIINNKYVSHKCTIVYEPLRRCAVVPDTVTSGRNYDQYFDIVYIPNNTLHDGKWSFDESIFTKLDDSTSDIVHFKVNPEAPDGTYELTFTPTGVDGQTTEDVKIKWTIKDGAGGDNPPSKKKRRKIWDSIKKILKF